MGNFDKRFVIKEAESILKQCNKKYPGQNDKNKIIELKTKNKKLKRKNTILKIITGVMSVLFFVSLF